MNIDEIKLGSRVAFEINAKMGVKTGTVLSFSGERVCVRFDLGYSRWVSVQKLEKIKSADQ